MIKTKYKDKSLKCFTKQELKIISESLKYYENIKWDSEDTKWQKTINKLIKKVEDIKNDKNN